MLPRETPHLLLIPGLACDQSVWEPLYPQLSSHAILWVPELGVCNSIEAMAQAVLHEAPALEFALVGHSLGGRIALEMVRQAPHRVKRLALLDTGWQARNPDASGTAEAAQRQALVALAKEQGMRAMAARWSPPMLHPDAVGSAVHHTVLAMIERQSVERFAAQQMALLNRPNAEAVLAAIRCPTLILCGEQDTWSPPERHRAMLEKVRHAQLALIPESGHMSPMEQPNAVGKAVLSWLTNHATHESN